MSAETTEKRRREKLNIAEGALRNAYRFYDSECAARLGVSLATRRPAIVAHRRAIEAAVYIATIEKHLQSDPANVEKWTTQATDHFERYAPLSVDAAENGAIMALAGTSVAAISGGLLTLVLPGLGSPVLMTALLGAKRTYDHARTPDRMSQERHLLDYWRILNGNSQHEEDVGELPDRPMLVDHAANSYFHS